jgi:uncharacterized membrane protein (DUF106 family)
MFLDPVFSPLLSLPPLLAILIVSIAISLVMVLIYRWMTDQKLMKELKEEIKDIQKKMKAVKDNPKKLMDLQKKAMESNMKYMMQSFKPTLVTFIPIIIIFAWLNSHMGYYPLTENNQFTVSALFQEGTQGTIEMVNVPQGITLQNSASQGILDAKAEWILTGSAGTYYLNYNYMNKTFQHQVIITKGERSYAKPLLFEKDLGLKGSGLKSVTISNRKVQPFKEAGILGKIPWIGGFGWLGTYIVFSLIFSIVFRKVFKVY